MDISSAFFGAIKAKIMMVVFVPLILVSLSFNGLLWLSNKGLHVDLAQAQKKLATCEAIQEAHEDNAREMEQQIRDIEEHCLKLQQHEKTTPKRPELSPLDQRTLDEFILRHQKHKPRDAD